MKPNYCLVLLGLFMLITDSLQSHPLFSLQPAIKAIDEQDAEILLQQQQDLENNDDPNTVSGNELAEQFLRFLEPEKTTEEKLQYYKPLHNLLTSHGNKDGNRDLLDFVQPDDVDVSQHWKRTLLPWLPAKRFFVSKRSLQEAQSKKISHDLEGIYGEKQQKPEKHSYDASDCKPRQKTKEKREAFESFKRSFTWPKYFDNMFGIDKKSSRHFEDDSRNAMDHKMGHKLKLMSMEDIVEHLSALFRKKAYDDLEKLQKTREQLKQSDEFDDMLKKYLDD